MKTILISYINRSGSTFLLNELSKFTKFGCLPEADQLVKLLFSKKPFTNLNPTQLTPHLNNTLKDQKLTKATLSPDFSFATPDRNDTPSIIFLQCLEEIANEIWPDAAVVVFKNTNCHQIYAKHFFNNNDVALVFLTRDPRAIYYSQKNAIGSWNKPMTASPAQTAVEWNIFMSHKNKLLKKYPERVLEVKYENLILNSEEEVKRIMMLIEPKFSHSSTRPKSYARLIPEKLQHIHKNIDIEAQPSFISKWKNGLSEHEVEDIEILCGNKMVNEGYLLKKRRGTIQFILTHSLGIKWRAITLAKKWRGIETPQKDER